MPQTLLALLALTAASLVAMGQQRASIHTFERQLVNEYHIAASGVMMHVMELIAARSFDETTTPEAIRNAVLASDPTPIPQQASEFSHRDQFGLHDRGGAGCNLERPVLTPACDDVDDLHGITWAPISARLSNGEELPFEVSVEVFYVDEADPTQPVTYRTKNKRVILRARTPLLPQVEELVHLERVVAYDPIKAEAEYEQAYCPIGMDLDDC